MSKRRTDPARDIARAFIPLLTAILLSACVETTAPELLTVEKSISTPATLSMDEDPCGEGGVCIECPAEDHDPTSPCYTGPENPGEECIGPQCSFSNAVAFVSDPPDSAVVGGSYVPFALGEWETFGYPAIISSLTPDVCPLTSGTVSFIAAGTCTIAADQPGDLEVPAAIQVRQTFEVYSNQWAFEGFFAPLSDSPKPNSAKAGSAVPVKFSLGGDRGLEIFSTGSPYSEAIQCPQGGPTMQSVAAESRSNGVLSYDAVTGIYNFVWSTEKEWKDSCRRLTISLVDGSSHSVTVAFR